MPTGYTDKVQDGTVTELEEYALICARQFGALISMRDDPMDKEIPEFKPDSFYKEYLEEARKEYDEFLSFDSSELYECYLEEGKEDLDRRINYLREKSDSRINYETMLHKVIIWEPPTEEHVALREFMISQLKESIKFDCTIHDTINFQEFEDWHNAKLDSLISSTENYKREHDKEVTRVASRNKWVKDLKDAFTED